MSFIEEIQQRILRQNTLLHSRCADAIERLQSENKSLKEQLSVLQVGCSCFEEAIEVICDHCGGVQRIAPNFIYGGAYDCDDKEIEKQLTREHKWICRNGEHFCCEECAK